VSHGGYREGEIVAGFSTKVDEPQERAEGSDQRLRRRRPTLSGTFQKKVSNGLSTPLADILTERPEQVRGTASVLPKSRMLHPAMRLKPFAEGIHKSWIGGRILNRLPRADRASDEVSMEKLHSKTRVVANLSSLEMRASASAKMTIKGIQRVEIDVRQTAALPLNEAAEMGGGTNVSNGAGWGISVVFELTCERIDVWSTDSTAQAPQRLGSGKEVL
jgi:hypothetical protein